MATNEKSQPQSGYQAAPPPYSTGSPNPYPPAGQQYGMPSSTTGPDGGFPQPMPQPMATTVPIATTMTYMQSFGDYPVTTNCPNCRNHVTTRVTHVPGTMAWLLCLLMCFFFLWCCAFIPFCVDSMQTVYHDCPSCNYRIGFVAR